MRLGRKIVIVCGAITALLGLLNYVVAFATNAYAVKPQEGIFHLLLFTLVDVAVPALVFAGAYLHSVKRKSAGLTLLISCSVFSILYTLYTLFVILVSWYYPSRLAIIVLAPSIMAFVTAIFAAIDRGRYIKASTPLDWRKLSE